MTEDFSEKTGENIYQKTAMPLDEVTFDGNDGVFLERDKDSKKDNKTGAYERKQLTQPGEELEVVYLKIRRAISYYDEAQEKFWRTNEHNHKRETVVLYKADGTKEVGTAEELRTKYDFLSTQQIVYCYLPKYEKVVRLIVKGASLGSRFEHETEVLKFYDYLQKFGKDEHTYQFVTKLRPVEEINKMRKKYFAISFVRGEQLDEESQAKVLGMINEVHDRVVAIDSKLNFTVSKKTEALKENIPTIDQQNDTEMMPDNYKFVDESQEIDVKDIPF